jgi:hypothetical protein
MEIIMASAFEYVPRESKDRPGPAIKAFKTDGQWYEQLAMAKDSKAFWKH